MNTSKEKVKDDESPERIWRIVGRICVTVLLLGLLAGIAVLVLMWKTR